MQRSSSNVVRDIQTGQKLEACLRELGLSDGVVVEVHASLSSLGYFVGGAAEVVDTLMNTVRENGTLLMPMQTDANTDPSVWTDPKLDPSLWQLVRDNTPAYHPEIKDLGEMGAVAENFRHRNGVVFSGHPSLSYAAWGRYAKLLCNRQSLHFPLAEESPTARLYELRGYVLMIGTDYDTCTCMHLAEYRTESRPIGVYSAPLANENEVTWKRYLDLKLNSADFKKIGGLMEQQGMVRTTMLGNCRIRLFSAVDAIDTACQYFDRTSVYELYR